jgi:hypothetical protein
MKTFAGIAVVVLAVFLVPFLATTSKKGAEEQLTHGLPWQIDTPAPGQSRVFGLTLGNSLTGPKASILADARQRFKEPFKLALVAPNEGPLSLEAYFETVSLGTLTGRLLLTIDATPAELENMRQNADKAGYMESGTKKFLLSESDRTRADRLPLRGIAFIPAANLDDKTVISRFGVPMERVQQGETLEHFLYPDKGVDVVIDSKGKEVLQYVAPADFARLRDPLSKK